MNSVFLSGQLNPYQQSVLALLLPTLSLVRSCNSMYSPECVAALHPSLARVHQLPQHERLSVLNSKVKPPSHDYSVS